MGFCTNCGRQVRGDMVFCPGCGADLSSNETEGARPREVAAPPPPFAPGPVGMPMAPYGLPMYYRPPMTGKRVVNIIGAVVLIVDACMALLLGLVLSTMSDLYGEAALMLGGGILAIICAIGVLISLNPVLNIMGPLALVSTAVILWAFEGEAFIISIIGMSIAVVSLVLLVVGWSDMVARYEAKAMGVHPSFSGQRQAMQGAPPPAYGGAEPPSVMNLRR